MPGPRMLSAPRKETVLMVDIVVPCRGKEGGLSRRCKASRLIWTEESPPTCQIAFCRVYMDDCALVLCLIADALAICICQVRLGQLKFAAREDAIALAALWPASR